MQRIASGLIKKMKTKLTSPVTYTLPIGDSLVEMNPLIGKEIQLTYEETIECIHCGRTTKKSFAQGYCFPCMRSLAQCDSCIMSPEKCHFAEGTCREPDWAQTHCMVDHVVYLSLTAGLKVGLTRGTQVPTRWIDQGANEALPILTVSTRRLAGLIEVMFKEHVSDRTSWQKMLKNEVQEMDMQAEYQRLKALVQAQVTQLDAAEEGQIQWIEEPKVVQIEYPVLDYPSKVKSFNLDKTPEIKGLLKGIKGQYLILDTGVINLRKYTGYHLSLSAT